MKKILVSILLITYTFAASGASVDLHYCMGKLIGWDLDYTSKHGCNNCGMKTKPDKGCCDNKQIHAKVDNEQQAAYNNISLGTDPIAIAPEYSVFSDLLHNSLTNKLPLIHGPPLVNHTSVYLFNCNFRI